MLVPHVLVKCCVPSRDEGTLRAVQRQLFVSGVNVSFHIRQIVGAVVATFTLENSLVRMVHSIVDHKLSVSLKQFITIFTFDVFTLRLYSNIELPPVHMNTMNIA